MTDLTKRTPPAFVPGNFAQRVSEAIDAAAVHAGDRRRLLVCMPAGGTATAPGRIERTLMASPAWAELPPCFRGDDAIAGSFEGVPVRRDVFTDIEGVRIRLGDREMETVLTGDQTPSEVEIEGERRAGA